MQTEACGTEAGYQRHRYYDEKPCGPCAAARRADIGDINDAHRILGYEHPQRVAELRAELKAAGVILPGSWWGAVRRALAREHPERYQKLREQLRAARAAGRPGQVG